MDFGIDSEAFLADRLGELRSNPKVHKCVKNSSNTLGVLSGKKVSNPVCEVVLRPFEYQKTGV